MKYRRGLHRDRADHPWRKKQRDARNLIGGAHVGVKRTPGTVVSLRAFEGPKRNQLRCEGCTMHSLSAGIEVALNYINAPLGFVASPRDGYAGARCIGRAGAVDVPLADDGAMLSDLATYVSRFGVRPIGALNPAGYTDVTTGPGGNVNVEPNLIELEEDAKALIVGEYRLDLASLTAIDDLCALIDAGIPPWFGGPVGDFFESYHAGDPAVPAEPFGAGHATIGTGYFVNADGSIDFDILSSWSERFGDNGHARVSSAWVLSMWDAWALTVRRAA